MAPTESEPRRIQLQRTKGWRMPANTVKVDRTTIFGNPFSAEQHRAPAPSECSGSGWRGAARGRTPRFGRMQMFITKRAICLEALLSLHGKNLACWCPLPEPGEPDLCHAAVLLERLKSDRKPKPVSL